MKDRTTEHPILFSTPMVQAILERRKTMTRRICKYQYWSYSELFTVNCNGITQRVDKNVSCPYGKVKDKLWVREKFNVNRMPTGYPYNYYADDDVFTDKESELWKPSIHMPKSAARIWLEIVGIRVERLQDITVEDAIKEGIKKEKFTPTGEECYYFYPCKDLRDDSYLDDPKTSFYSLWKSINSQDSWDANPWVWVIEFNASIPSI